MNKDIMNQLMGGEGVRKMILSEQTNNPKTKEEMFNYLKKNGFQNSRHHGDYVCYHDKENGRVFDIYLGNPNNIFQVSALRVNYEDPGVLGSEGLIGNFAGGKGPMKRFSFKDAQDLIKKLKKIPS